MFARSIRSAARAVLPRASASSTVVACSAVARSASLVVPSAVSSLSFRRAFSEYPENGTPRSPRQENPPHSSIYVGNLPFDTTVQDLENLFREQRPVRIALPQRDGVPSGFGFVDFESIPDATAAVETFNEQTFSGRTLRISYARPRLSPEERDAQRESRGQNPPSTSVFIGGIADITEEELREFLSAFSTDFIAARIARDRETGASRGFAFVEFSDVAQAKAVKEALEGTPLPNGTIPRIDYGKEKAAYVGRAQRTPYPRRNDY